MFLNLLSQLFVVLLAVVFCCGHPRVHPPNASRIIGGRPAQPEEFPHQVSLRTLEEGRFFCGGSIIAQSWVLSAAHCVENRAQNGVIVVVGTNYLDAGGSQHQSQRIVLHPEYDNVTLAYDAVVIQTQVPFVYNQFVAPINLGSTHVGAGVYAMVSGWGGMGRDGPPFPNELQALEKVILTNADCRSRHPAENAHRIVDHKICGYDRYGGGACFGDSGGALVAENSVIGIVAWGHDGCGGGMYPDVYVRVSYIYEWVHNTISQ